MKIRIFSVGKMKQSFVLDGEQEYLKRLGPHVHLSIEELPVGKGNDVESIKQQEAENLSKRLRQGEFLVVLDENGQKFSSIAFSEFLSAKLSQGTSRFVFAIGGAYGWDDSVRNQADLLLSLSQLTFPYQLARLVLIEQLYRAHSLMQGTPYHKG